jgi:hypothetical protein
MLHFVSSQSHSASGTRSTPPSLVRRFKDCDVLDYLHWVTLPVYDGLIPQLNTGRYITIGDTYESYSLAYALGMPIRVSRLYKVANSVAVELKFSSMNCAGHTVHRTELS